MNIRPYYYTYAGGVGFLFGLVIARFGILEIVSWYVLLVAGFVCMFIFTRWGRIIGAAIVLLALGSLRWSSSQPVISDSHVAWYTGQSVRLVGVVSSEIDVRQDKQQLTIQAQNINQRVVLGKVLITVPLFPEYHYGDELDVTGFLQIPPSFPDFQYDKYLERHGVYAVMYYPEVRLIEQKGGNVVLWHVLNLKQLLIRRVNELLPEPAASFLGGLLWGAKRAIAPEVLEHFNLTGTTHIIALSGYNITILGVIIFWLAPWFGVSRRRAFWLVVSCVIFFILLTGWPASVLRAGLMGILVLIAYRYNIGRNVGILLLLSAVIMCAINPLILFYDVGFQLSFLATIGLLYVAPLLQKKLVCLPQVLALRETLATTTAAILMTAPLVVYQFSRFSVVALLVNALILFVIPFTMGLGFLSVLTSFIYYPFGQVMMWVTYLPLRYILIVTEWFAAWRWSSLSITRFSWLVLLGFYAVLGLVLFIPRVWPTKK